MDNNVSQVPIQSFYYPWKHRVHGRETIYESLCLGKQDYM